MTTHPNHDHRGARGVTTTGAPMPETIIRSTRAAVIEHDIEHIYDESTRVIVRLWAQQSIDARALEVAGLVSSLAQRLERAAREGQLNDAELEAIDTLPAALGQLLASIDPERAR